MLNLIRDRRGVTAFATIIALTPLIGVVAVGAEAGSWYVTKQVAQNAADAAAYSGALALVCSLPGASCVPDTQTVPYRGKEFAAQNAFCNTGDTSYPNSKCSTNLGKGVLAVGEDQYAHFMEWGQRKFCSGRSQPDTADGSLGNSGLDLRHRRWPSDCSGLCPDQDPMRLGVDRLFQFPRQRKRQRAQLRHCLERSGQQRAKLHRRRDKPRQSSTVAVGCRRLHGRRKVLWQRIDLSSAGHGPLLQSR